MNLSYDKSDRDKQTVICLLAFFEEKLLFPKSLTPLTLRWQAEAFDLTIFRDKLARI